VLLRRPLFLTLVMASVAAMLTSGAVPVRLVFSVSLYWCFVPIVEVIALLLVTASRQEAAGARSTTIDVYFMGHAAWTLALLAIGLTLSSAPASTIWPMVTTVVPAILAGVIAWSAYVDYWFFRTVLNAPSRRAIRDTAMVRLITWPIVFIVFALPALTPWELVAEIGDALREIF
jgi:hypothetical protein